MLGGSENGDAGAMRRSVSWVGNKDAIVPQLGAISIVPVADSRGGIDVHITVRRFGSKLRPEKMAYGMAVKDDLSLLWLPSKRADENTSFTGDEHALVRSALDVMGPDEMPFFAEVLRNAAARYVKYHTDLAVDRHNYIEVLRGFEDAGGLTGRDAANKRLRIERRVARHQDNINAAVAALTDFVGTSVDLSSDEVLMEWEQAKHHFQWSRIEQFSM